MSAVLQDTTLCAIVRDEMMNPAGGIVRFVNMALPHVEAGVIVDTGSIDGTREALEELSARYPHLRVFDLKFQDYAQSRNYSLGEVQTRRALVLDADEVITGDDFETLRAFLEEPTCKGYSFYFKVVGHDGKEYSGMGHNPRLFDKSGKITYINCRGNKGEWLHHEGNTPPGPQLCGLPEWAMLPPVSIYHFVSAPNGLLKKREWYKCASQHSLAPLLAPGFAEWKQFNPHRDNVKYR